ncbi:MAG: radical SAM protein [Oligoflexia bacterium]|nr:radical SAM protein [Oligoflexia bacterium]
MILLIRPSYVPPNSKNYECSLPIGLLSLGTSLVDNNVNVKIIDMMTMKDAWERIFSYVNEAVFVGITAMTSQVGNGIDIVKRLKINEKKVPIVWGGFHPSLFPNGTLNSEYCDIVCEGEGDITIVELYKSFMGTMPIEDVTGVWYKDRGNLLRTKKRDLLTKIPRLRYELLENIDEYIPQNLYPIEKNKVRCLQIHAGRGCFYRCTFCAENVEFKHRKKEASVIFEEMVNLVDRFKLDYIDIQDSDFFCSKKRIDELIKIIVESKSKINWIANCRANYFNQNYLNDNYLEKLALSGCKKVGLGVESGSDEFLSYIKKSITVNHVKKAIASLNKSGVMVAFSFIIGMPHETISDMKKTLKLIWHIINNSKRYYIIGPALYRPYPGSEMHDQAIASGYRPPTSIEEWSNLHFDYHGFVPGSLFPHMRGKERFTKYVRHIVDYRHLKNRKSTLLFFYIYNFLVLSRIKYDCFIFLYEHYPLYYARLTINRCRAIFGILKNV